MKEIEEYNDSTIPTSFIDTVKEAPKMPNYLKKANEMAAFLEENPFPTAWLQEMKNSDIKRGFEQNKSIEQIAQAVRLPKEEVLSRLEEMGLIEPVIA
jgi:hypothetical protein